MPLLLVLAVVLLVLLAFEVVFWFTKTVALCEACTLPLLHVSEYVVVWFADTVSLPERARAPDHPPDAMHEIAFETFQVIIEEPPVLILEGFATILIEGCTGDPLPPELDDDDEPPVDPPAEVDEEPLPEPEEVVEDDEPLPEPDEVELPPPLVVPPVLPEELPLPPEVPELTAAITVAVNVLVVNAE